jgi:hypothetical protein
VREGPRGGTAGRAAGRAAARRGPRLSAMAACLAVSQHVPAERAQRLISDLTGGVVPAGFAHSCGAKAAGLVKDPVALRDIRLIGLGP